MLLTANRQQIMNVRLQICTTVAVVVMALTLRHHQHHHTSGNDIPQADAAAKLQFL